MKKKRLWILTMGTFVVVSIPFISIITGTKATASVENTTYTPLTASQIDSFKPLGLEISSGVSATLAAQKVESSAASSALNATDNLMKEFNATSRNIQYMVISRKYGVDRSAYAKVDPSLTTGDSHFTNNLFRNIPCYLVTINGVDIPSASSPAGGSGALPAHSLQVLVDATNSKILLMFAIHQDH